MPNPAPTPSGPLSYSHEDNATTRALQDVARESAPQPSAAEKAYFQERERQRAASEAELDRRVAEALPDVRVHYKQGAYRVVDGQLEELGVSRHTVGAPRNDGRPHVERRASMGVGPISGSDIVTVNGMEMELETAEQLGYVKREGNSIEWTPRGAALDPQSQAARHAQARSDLIADVRARHGDSMADALAASPNQLELLLEQAEAEKTPPAPLSEADRARLSPTIDRAGVVDVDVARHHLAADPATERVVIEALVNGDPSTLNAAQLAETFNVRPEQVADVTQELILDTVSAAGDALAQAGLSDDAVSLLSELAPDAANRAARAAARGDMSPLVDAVRSSSPVLEALAAYPSAVLDQAVGRHEGFSVLKTGRDAYVVRYDDGSVDSLRAALVSGRLKVLE